MPISANEFGKLAKKGKGGFATSEDRQKILGAIKDGQLYTDQEISKVTGMPRKLVRTRLNVMVRDKLVRRGYQTDGTAYFGLTEKGAKRVGV